MKINKLHIVGFGGLKNCELFLDKNFNMIQGPNEYGKTTLFAFIRAMLFGLKGTRRSIVRDYERYLPLDNPTEFRGEMQVELYGEEYLIDRNFHRKTRYCRVQNLDTGKELTEEEWYALLAPMDYEAFTNTCYVSANTSMPGKAFMDTLQERIIGMAQSNSDDIFVHSSISRLKEQQKVLRARLRNLPALYEAELLDEHAALEEQVELIENRLKEAHAKPPEDPDEERTFSPVRIWLPAAIFLVAGLAAALLPNAAAWLSLPLIGIAACLGLYGGYRYMTRPTPEPPVEIDGEDSGILYGRLEELYKQQAKNDEALKRLKAVSEQRAEIEEDLKAIDLACQEINAIAKQIYASNTKELNSRLSQIFAYVTGGAYQGVIVNDEMNIYAMKDGRLYAFYHLSKGTLEQLFLSLRIVALDLLYKGMDLPLIIDDGFVHYDYKRYKLTLEMLEKMNHQAIIFNLSKSVL